MCLFPFVEKERIQDRNNFMQKYSIHNEEKLKEILKQNKFPPFRYNQIENAIYKNFVTDFDEI